MTASPGDWKVPGEHERTIRCKRSYEITLLYNDSNNEYSTKKEMKEDESTLHGC